MDMNDASMMDPGMATAGRKRGISGSTLKLIAIFTMLIDHTAATILQNTLVARGMNNLDPTDVQATMQFYADNAFLNGAMMVMRLIGRIAFPIFCFLLVEGFLHTRNVTKYAVRLALFAAISEIPFDLAFNNKVLEGTHQNVFFTLLIGLLILIGFKTIKEKAEHTKKVDNTEKVQPWLSILGVLGALAVGGYVALLIYKIMAVVGQTLNAMGLTTADTGIGAAVILGIVFAAVALVVYAIMCKKTSLQTASLRFADLFVLMIGMVVADLLRTDYSGFGVLTVAVVYGLRKSHFKSMLGACITLTIMTPMEITSFINLIFIRLYNGTRGLRLKYIFYAFYPVHLFILYLICRGANLV
ncbi:MAG TPA: hypothetical protein GXX75_12720 [Clostridiales bacterium]|nr:hypothetical protein [Clostridiales bacterium]